MKKKKKENLEPICAFMHVL